VWFLTQVVVMVMSAVATLVGTTTGVVFELVAPVAMVVVGSASPSLVVLPQGSGKLPIARSLASDDWGYAAGSRQW